MVMKWDFEFLLRGVYPDHDPWGDPWPVGSVRDARKGQWLAEGLRGAVVLARADTEQTVNHWGLSHWRTYTPCSKCRCNRGQGWCNVAPSLEGAFLAHGT